MLNLLFLKSEKFRKNFGSFIVLLIITSSGIANAEFNTQEETTFKDEVARFNLFLQHEFETKIHLSKDWHSSKPAFSANSMSLAGKVIRVSGHDFRSNSLAAFRLGLCHEAGHYLAGAPFIRVSGNSVALINRMEVAAEGQSDYFASYCLKKYADYLADNGAKISGVNPSAEIADFCRHANDKVKCEYVATAALDLVNYLSKEIAKSLGTESTPLKFADYKNVVKAEHTLDVRHEYPELNCRLATYFAGIRCSNENAPLQQFVCPSGDGARPDCWYIQK